MASSDAAAPPAEKAKNDKPWVLGGRWSGKHVMEEPELKMVVFNLREEYFKEYRVLKREGGGQIDQKVVSDLQSKYDEKLNVAAAALMHSRSSGSSASAGAPSSTQDMQLMIETTVEATVIKCLQTFMNVNRENGFQRLCNGGVGDELNAIRTQLTEMKKGAESVVDDAATLIAQDEGHEKYLEALEMAAKKLMEDDRDVVLEAAVEGLDEDDVLERAKQDYMEENEEEVINACIEKASDDDEYLEQLVQKLADKPEMISGVLQHADFLDNMPDSDEEKFLEHAKEIRRKRRRKA